jgi:hypothetical protein
LWNGENQITGDLMHLIGNNTTRELDSLKYSTIPFWSQRTHWELAQSGKELNLFGKFEEGKLRDVDIVKTPKFITCVMMKKNSLVSTKNKSSNLLFADNDIETILSITR